ncbi:MAG: acyl-CoA thioesterase [Euryarchaeota archaeon]|nr:acyl-CoA thioesterase [Euryarchaeota archaeon]
MAVEHKRPVDWPMVDMAEVVYYPQYFDLAHRFFEESWGEICGINYATLTLQDRVGFPAVKTDAEHLAPLRYGDTICCKLWVSNLGDKSCTWSYEFTNQEGVLVWRATVVTVCVDLDSFKSIIIPKKLAEGLEKCSLES